MTSVKGDQKQHIDDGNPTKTSQTNKLPDTVAENLSPPAKRLGDPVKNRVKRGDKTLPTPTLGYGSLTSVTSSSLVAR